MPATTVKLDDDLKTRLRQLATSKQRSAHWLMVQAIRDYVEREERREQLLREAREAWDQYQATGLHISGEEARAWLDSWGTEAETDPPECHR